MAKVLHLTHTDIRTDSRILKEMDSIASHIDCTVKGIGIDRVSNVARGDQSEQVELEAIAVRSRSMKRLPRVLRHPANLVEFYARALVQAVRFRPDLVHCHDTTALPAGALVKVLRGSKLIYDAHELESEKTGMSPMMGRLTLRLEKLLWRLIDGLIVVSPSIQEWYEENVGPQRTEIVLNAPIIAASSGAIADDYLRNTFPIAADSKIFIYIGGLEKGRGVEMILEAFQEPDMHASVVFLGSGHLQAEVKRVAAEHANVFHHEPVAHQDVVAVARSADFGLSLAENVSLSYYYSLPNKLFEYVFGGIPVLASDVPDIAKILKDHDLGVCCDLTPDGVLRGIDAIQQRKFDIRTEDLDHLTWDAQAHKLVSLYEELLPDSRVLRQLPTVATE